MNMPPNILIHAFALGIGASLCMDAWNWLLKRALRIPSLNYAMLGRWVLHMPDGTFSHVRIAAAAPKRGELAVGWAAHFTIGIALALVFLALAPRDWPVRPTLLPALLYGLVTVVFPLFVLQPALGLGIASAKTPKPALARVKSVVTHLVFGTGLYACAVALGLLDRAN